MRQCEWCGLISDDQNVCQWCKRPFPGATLPHGTEVQPRVLPGYIALLLFAIVGCVGLAVALITRAPNAVVVEPAPVYETAVPARGVHSMGQALPLASPPRAPRNYSNVKSYSSAEPRPRRSEATHEGNIAVATPAFQEDSQSVEEATQEPASPEMTIASANFGYREDESGSQMAAGTIVIINEGNVALSNFTMNLQVDGVVYRLLPFNGNLRTPRTLSDLTVQPGQRLSIPVITNRPFTPSEGSVKSVVVQARGEEGGRLMETIDIP